MKLFLALTLALALQGCANSFACKGFPQFSACKSASQAYRATNRGAPPEYGFQGVTEAADRRGEWPSGEHRVERTSAQTLKIWQAPYEDEQGDLIGSSTVLAEIEPRHWRMGQNQKPIPRRIAPLKAPSPQAMPDSTEDRGGFPLFPTPQGPRRLHVEEVDYREP